MAVEKAWKIQGISFLLLSGHPVLVLATVFVIGLLPLSQIAVSRSCKDKQSNVCNERWCNAVWSQWHWWMQVPCCHIVGNSWCLHVVTKCGSLESLVYTIILHLLLLLGCHALDAVTTLTGDACCHRFCIFLYSSRARKNWGQIGEKEDGQSVGGIRVGGCGMQSTNVCCKAYVIVTRMMCKSMWSSFHVLSTPDIKWWGLSDDWSIMYVCLKVQRRCR